MELITEPMSGKLGYYTADLDNLYFAGMVDPISTNNNPDHFIYIYDKNLTEVDRIDMYTFAPEGEISFIV